ncbi:MAG: FAD-linked oxidase C-terminal domain-containing protein [Chloroflexota bacterium]
MVIANPRMTFAILQSLRQIVGADGLLSEPERLRTYESDGLTNYRVMPAGVVLPRSTAQVQAVVRLCHEHRIPFVARGHGTGLSGGALPVADGLVISLARMNRVLAVDYENARIVVEPGVINLHVTQHVAARGYYYAPDPSSQQVCSIGGNVAENSGGAHCLKYGFTTNHVLGATVVLPDGEIAHIGGTTLDTPGLDLLGVMVGAEGTLGVVTEVTLRLTRRPEAVQLVMGAFETTDQAGGAVSDIIAAGILPAAMEMMDNLSIQAVELATHAGYPTTAGALLLVELDGPLAEVDALIGSIESICRTNGAWEVRRAADAAERALMWKGRKAAFAAMGRMSPNYYVQDGVIPRTTLPAVLRRIDELAAEYDMRVANVFHAGDGNLHPLVLYDGRITGELDRAEELATKILLTCVEHGGSLTGEHGIGVDKMKHMPKLFTEDDLDTMQRVRCAFDPHHLSNPGKVFPTPRLCGETPGPGHLHPLVESGQAEMF